ncbi:peptide ABC transporter substrate-binding protein [Heyndrickxia ginsengihumi]|uniref:peptide ABC transporter substrate-binding protein n=1 Tax=Heyndrickxia ginsengihumi TaxID=363870 RepID=UPI003D1A03A8
MSRTKARFTALLSLTAVLSLGLAACGGNSSSDSSSSSTSSKSTKQVLNITEKDTIPTMDSTMNEDIVSSTVMDQVFEGLLRLDKNDQPAPGIAKEMPKTNKAQTVYTFKLRDAKWSNGDPVTANDFVYAWRKAIDPKQASPYGPYLMDGVIKNATAITNKKMKPDQLGIKALDDKTVQVTLEKATPYFETLITSSTFLPQNQKYVESKGKDYATSSDNLIYDGPFVLTKWNGTSDSWTYKKNNSYWDAKSVKLSQINVNVVKDASTGVNLYNTGKLDRTLLNGEQALQMKSKSDYTTYLSPSTFYLDFNQKNSALSNVNIRKALSLAFDKKGITDSIVADGAIPLDGFIPANFVKDPKTGKDFRAENGKLNAYNKAEAQKYWKKGLKEIGKSSLTLRYLGDDTDVAKKLGEYMQNQLQTNLPGLKLQVSQVPFKIRLERWDKGDYDIVMSGWNPDYTDPYTFMSLFLSDSPENHSSYASKEYDKLINDAETTLATDPEKRWAAIQKAEKLLVQQDAAVAPVFQKGWAFLQQPYVKGVVKNASGTDFTYKWAYIQK